MWRYSGKNIEIKIFRNTVYTATINKGACLNEHAPRREILCILFTKNSTKHYVYNFIS